jgi:hypothetical protein
VCVETEKIELIKARRGTASDSMANFIGRQVPGPTEEGTVVRQACRN